MKESAPACRSGCDSAREKEGERTSACACWGSCCAAALLIGSTAPFRFLRICFCFCLRRRYCRCLSRVALTAAAGLSDEKERESKMPGRVQPSKKNVRTLDEFTKRSTHLE